MTARLRHRISTAATPSSKQRDAAPKPSNAAFRVAARAALALTVAAPGAGGALVRGTALGTVLTAAAAAPPPLAPPFELPRLPMPAGIGQLILPAGVAHPLPLVVTIPDAPGEDGRSEPYVELLAARGAAVLVLGLGEDADGSDPPAEPAASPEAVATALAWAERDGRFDPRRIALVGFGAGGRAVLAAWTGRPAVALYPDCRDLLLPEAGPALVLHGSDAPDAAACTLLPRVPGVTVKELGDAGHGWDAPGASRPDGGPNLPDPARRRPVRAGPDLRATFDAAEAIGTFLENSLVLKRRVDLRWEAAR